MLDEPQQTRLAAHKIQLGITLKTKRTSTKHGKKPLKQGKLSTNVITAQYDKEVAMPTAKDPFLRFPPHVAPGPFAPALLFAEKVNLDTVLDRE